MLNLLNSAHSEIGVRFTKVSKNYETIKTILSFTESTLQENYKIHFSFESVYSHLYSILMENRSTDFGDLREWCYDYLNRAGTIPLKLPTTIPSENISVQMAQFLNEYSFDKALNIFLKLLEDELNSSFDSNSSTSFVLFLSFFTSFYSGKSLTLPRPMGSGMISVDRALVSRALEFQDLQSVLSPSNLFSFNLLVGDFDAAINFAAELDQNRIKIALKVLERSFRLDFQKPDNIRITNVEQDLFQLAKNRIVENENDSSKPGMDVNA